MPQLAELRITAIDNDGNTIIGASVTVYREGASVAAATSSTAPITISVLHPGKIKTGDLVTVGSFPIDATLIGQTFLVTNVSSSAIILDSFTGTLTVGVNDRLIPINDQPTIYQDDQGVNEATNPIVTDSSGEARGFVEYAAYDVITSAAGGNILPRLQEGVVCSTEAPGQIRFADAFATLSDTGGIQEAIDDLPSTGGMVRLSNRTYLINSTLNITKSDVTVEGVGDGSLLQMNDSPGVHFFGQQSLGITGSRFTVRNLKLDGVNSSNTNGRGFNFGTCSDCLLDNVTIVNMSDAAVGTNAAGPSTTTRLRVINCRIDSPGDAGSTDGYGIILNNASDSIIRGNYINNTRAASIFGFGTSTNNLIEGNRVVASLDNGIRWGSNGQACSSWIVTDNEVRGCGVDGIRADGSNAIVADNRSVSNTGSGIKSDGLLTSCLWASNYIKSNGNKGIYLNNTNGVCTDITIQNNIVDTNTGDGIRIDSSLAANACTSISIINNTSVSNTAYGLLLNQASVASTFKVRSNTYRNNTTAAENLAQHANNVYGPFEVQKTNITSGATINVTGDGLHLVTGTADITSITAAPAGTRITLLFSGTAATNGVVDGSNLKLASTFAYTPDDTLSLISDGTNWYELGRSVN